MPPAAYAAQDCDPSGSVDDFCFPDPLSLRFSATVRKLPKDGN
jgi:hypothetical protein